MKYNLDKDKILLSVDKGEYVNKSLLKIANNNNITFGWINGIGAILDPEVGYFDVQKKEYVKKTIEGEYELVSLLGNITYKEGNLFVHSHIIFTDTDFRAYGGHLFDCRIAAAGEFIIFKGEEKLERLYSNDVGLHLWNCKI
jgi:predicted DNA-binding protein with PD1-like motif